MSRPELTAAEAERLAATIGALPANAHTALEIGFHDFRLTQPLHERLDLVSIDLPHGVSVRHGFRLAFADIRNLPFKDRSFDIIVCTEVLEHLPDKVLQTGIEELQRVSARYILITVPYRQPIWNYRFKCRHCGHECNNMDHVQYLDEHRLQRLFRHSRIIDAQLISSVSGSAPAWLYSLARRAGNVWYKLMFRTSCPACRRLPAAKSPTLFGHILKRVIWRWEAAVARRPVWVLAVFELSVASEVATAGPVIESLSDPLVVRYALR